MNEHIFTVILVVLIYVGCVAFVTLMIYLFWDNEDCQKTRDGYICYHRHDGLECGNKKVL